MKRDIRQIHEVFAPHDPAHGIKGTPESYRKSIDQIAYTTDMTSSRDSRMARLPKLRRPLAAAAAVAVLATAGVGLYEARRPSPDSLQATPALLAFNRPTKYMNARQVLLRAAMRAKLQRNTLGQGKYQYVETRSWSLDSAISGQAIDSKVISLITQQWISANGSGRLRQSLLEPNGSSSQISNNTYGPGGLSLIWKPGTLSSRPEILRSQLKVGHPARLGPAEVMTAAEDLYSEQPLSPAVRAAILQVIGALPGLRYDGTVTDRAGRHGIAVSLDAAFSGLPTRYVMIFSPASGQLLDAEQILTKTAGRLHVAIPSVIAYTVYLSAKRTNAEHAK